MWELGARVWADFVGRMEGPLHFRLIVQPLVACVLAVRAGLRDARQQKPPYLWALAQAPGHRRDLLREAWKDAGTVLVAGVVLDEVLRVTWPLRPVHRETPRFAVIAYGKLGGKELGYASDLDLVFLYDDPAPEAAESYARFAQRINNWLTSITSAGVLYETDLRLRPDGAGGLLVSSLASFRDYQNRHAQLWEHQALTRARFVAGASDIGAGFERFRVEVLRQERDPGALRREVAAMRRKMHDAHPNRTRLFDLKHDRGGIIDVEFAVQYLVLAHAHAHAGLAANIGNLALLKLAARLGLVEEGRAQAAHDAYRRFRGLQHSLRLQGERYARVAPDTVADSRRAVLELWKEVMGNG